MKRLHIINRIDKVTTKDLNYFIVSKHRTKLMAIAIMWVVLFHSTVNFNLVEKSYIIRNLGNFIKDTGNCGVDIILFLSGIGMYFSWIKCKNTLTFYKHRFERIVPTYFMISIMLSIILMYLHFIDLKTFFLDSTGLRLWFKEGAMGWYITATMILYLFVPSFMRFYDKYKNKAIIMVIVLSVIINVICQIPELKHLRIFTSRIPIFFIGIKFGEMCYQKRIIKLNEIIIGLVCFCVAISILLFYYLNLQNDDRFYDLQKFGYLLMVIPMCFIISSIFEAISNVYRFKFLELIGSLTLEIYALHERLLVCLFNKLDISKMFDRYGIVYNIIVVIITIFSAICSNKIIKKIMDIILNFHKEMNIVKTYNRIISHNK